MTRSLTICALLFLAARTVNATELSAARPLFISNAIEREARRLSQSQPKPTSQDKSWARVRSLRGGTRILLRTQGPSSRNRYFLSADQSTLHVLDLSSVPLSGDPIDRLLRIASTQPEVLGDTTSAQKMVDGPLEIQSDSVIYKGRFIATIDRLVEVVSRAEVAEIDLIPEGHVSAGKAATIGALIAGVAGGTLVATSDAGRDVNPGAVGVLIFAPIGAGLGYLAGSIADSNSMKPAPVYRR